MSPRPRPRLGHARRVRRPVHRAVLRGPRGPLAAGAGADPAPVAPKVSRRRSTGRGAAGHAAAAHEHRSVRAAVAAAGRHVRRHAPARARRAQRPGDHRRPAAVGPAAKAIWPRCARAWRRPPRLLAMPRQRIEHDAWRGNYAGVARCISSGLTATEIDVPARALPAGPPGRGGEGAHPRHHRLPPGSPRARSIWRWPSTRRR